MTIKKEQPPARPWRNNLIMEQPSKIARMLVVLRNGEQRLITFTLSKGSCTVQELLRQVGVPFEPDTNIQCIPNPGQNIDYLVTVGVAFSLRKKQSEQQE